MKHFFHFVLFGTICLLLSYCEEEKAQPRVYPRINTLPVSNITEEGATFNADLYSLGTETIIEYGFVWGTYFNPLITSDKIVLPGNSAKEGVFKAEITSTLSEGIEYKVRPYVSTDIRIVYGNIVTFVSLGSMAPVITGFEPDSAAWGDTLKISGKHFSWVHYKNTVHLDQTECLMLSSTDTTIFVFVPYTLNKLESSVTIDLAGNIAEFPQKKFKLIPPLLRDFNPKQARWGDTIYIKGRNLDHISSFGNYLRLGDLGCQVLGVVSDSIISVRIPYELTTISNSLSIKINGYTMTGKHNFELLSPFFTFTPTEGTWGNSISLTGRFNILLPKNSVFFNTVKATITATASNALMITVPNGLSEIESNIIYKATPFEIVSSEVFRLKPPVIGSFTPVSGAGGTSVTIKGKYFGVSTPAVKFGEAPASVTSYNDSTIIVKVPSGGYGPVKISVTVRQQTIVSDDDFNIANPKINSIFPLAGTFNDEITITGENLVPLSGAPLVNFNGIGASVVSYNATNVVVQVPVEIDSIPGALQVIVGQNSVTSVENFTLTPHQINSVSTPGFNPGQDILITGQNFNPVASNNKVYWDIYELAVKSASGNEIIATWPDLLPRGTSNITINMGGYTRLSPEEFSSNSQWRRIPSPEIATNFADGYYVGVSIYGATLNNIGYLASAASNATWEFNPSDESWTKLNINYPSNWYHNRKMGEVVCRDTIYLIGGAGYYNTFMYAFDKTNNFWRTLSLPTNPGACVAFSLNDKIYFGLDFWKHNSTMWECNPANNYQWTNLGSFPQSLPGNYTTYFTLNNYGYVIFSDNSVWQFSADSLSWTRKANFPGEARVMAVSFVMNGSAYIGCGRTYSGSGIFDDFWKYDPATDSWVFVTRIPKPRHSAVAFTVNNKAYIGFGISGETNPDLYDFYEFDPNYPLK